MDPITFTIIFPDPVITAFQVASAPAMTAGNTLNIGLMGRLVALPNGMAVEVKGTDGIWHRQREFTEL